MRRIKTGDSVIVIAGKDRGKRGNVLQVSSDGGRVMVEKANMVKRHQRPTQKHPQGGIIEKEAFLHASNVMLVDGSGEAFRVNYKHADVDGADGATRRKVRYNAKTGEIVE